MQDHIAIYTTVESITLLLEFVLKVPATRNEPVTNQEDADELFLSSKTNSDIIDI